MRGTRRPGAAQSALLEHRLLGTRLGRRLLLLFVGCALVPSAAVALLTYHSVRAQLSEQSQERLNTLSSAIGRTIYERLNLLEGDLRKSAGSLARCAESDSAARGRSCGEDLVYGLDALGWVPDRGRARTLFGGSGAIATAAGMPLPALAPGQSAIVTIAEAGHSPTPLLVHRPSSLDRPGRFVATLVPTYLLGMGDIDALPTTVVPIVWDPALGAVVGVLPDSLVVPASVRREMSRSATGAFEWGEREAQYLATYWQLPQTRRFALPSWFVILSESRADVVAPAAGFARGFPLVVALSVVVVLVLGATQIRKSLVPLEELRQGTRRIASREFDTRVAISSGDEIEELARSFNAMATQLGRQFSALTTAAEIDRAVLSSMDSGAIVDTVLSRLPSMCPCDALAITLLDHHGEAATTWLESRSAGAQRTVSTATVAPAEARQLREHRECLVFGTGGPWPDYLGRVAAIGEAPVEVFPLFFGEELLGALAIRGRRPVSGDAPADDLLQLRRLADQVAVALSNARMVERVRFMAFYDSLTNLPNRVLHKQRLNEALARGRRLHRLVAVCFLDLDHFSRINDTLGHDVGDRLVQDVATRLLASCREGDSVARLGGGDEQGVDVARLGGDEFTIILPDIGEPQDAARVARRILETFDRPFRLGTQEVFVSTSIGIAIYPFDGADADDLLKNADVAMYHAKEQGRNTYRLFSASMNAEAVARMRMEQQLRRAIESSDFTMWYQPILDLRSREVVGAEALVRWAHKERGLVSPAEFMTISEESGLIVPLGEWILRTVCTQARTWQEEGLGSLRMSVNLSARQLRDEGFVELVRSVLDETGLAPELLELELTESMLMDPTGQLADTLRALATMGVSLAIDDFGTGYSSLSYLKHFPVASLKIDQSFVREVTTSADDAAITTAVIALARALNLSVVAEGVETREQAKFLLTHGCDMVQGYLIGRPTDAAAFGNLLRTGRIRGDLVSAA